MTLERRYTTKEPGVFEPPGRSAGDPVLYFVMKAAVARMGGITEAARQLGVSVPTLSVWIAINRRSKPDDAILQRMAEMSGISLQSFTDYYEKLAEYKKKEGLRRRA